MAFREGGKGPERVRAAKVLYPLVKVGMTNSDAAILLGGPDSSKAGRPNLFWDYSMGEKQNIQIEIEFDDNGDKVIRKHEVGLGIDPPPVPSPAISENLRPYIKDYAEAGATIRAGFIPYKSQVVWGEPLEVTFFAETLGPSDFHFGFGGDYRGVGRHDRIKITVTDAAGNPLADPRAGTPNFDGGGIMSSEILTPGGWTFKRSIDLTKFRTFEKPGDYTVTCTFAFDEPFAAPKQEPAKPVVISSFQFTILERTPERVAQVLDGLVTRAKSVAAKDLPAAIGLVASFGHEDAVPRLIQLTRTGAVEARAAALAALPLV